MSPRHSARFALVALLCFFSAALAVRPSAAQTIIDYAPIVSAPDSIDGVEGAALSFDVSAVDINEEAITSFTASGSAIDAGAVFTVTSPYYSTGHLSWTPGFAQAGTYSVTFIASNALTGSKTTIIKIANTDLAPEVSAPEGVGGAEGVRLSFDVSAFDPDEEAIDSFTAIGSAIGAGAVFSASDTHTSGTLSWTPAHGQAGDYSVMFTASNALSGSQTTSIHIAATDRPPVVTAPHAINGEEGGDVSFGVTASDPDGDLIFLSANLSSLPEGNDATFVRNESNTAGTFHWDMHVGDAGSYNVIFTATANDISRSATTQINVGPAGTTITGVLTWTPKPGDEGVYDVVFTASDAGGTSTATTRITVVRPPPSPAPAAPLAPRAPGSALTPQAPQKGPIISAPSGVTTPTGTPVTVAVSASTNPDPSPTAKPAAPIQLSARAVQTTTLTANLTVLPPGNDATFVVDSQPVISGPSAVTVPPGAPMTLTWTVSDPEGDAIDSFIANLSALPAANLGTFTTNALHTSGTLTWTPRLVDVGTYVVNFTAFNRLVGTASTTITVSPVAAARIFTLFGLTKIFLGSFLPVHCLQIEPINRSFALSDVDLATVRMISPGTGTVSEISARQRLSIIADLNFNRIPDLTVCFDKADLRALFSSLTRRTAVTIKIQGQLRSGAYFAGSLAVEVIPVGSGIGWVSVSPNPLNPQAKLSLMLVKPGQLKVALYDIQGRLVRELADETNAAPGPREILIDGKDSKGAPLASGVYFYRVESADGVHKGRFAIVR